MATYFGIATIGYLVSSIFIHGAYPRYFWLIVGIALSLPQAVRNTLSAESDQG